MVQRGRYAAPSSGWPIHRFRSYLNDLAREVQVAGGRIGLDVEIDHVDNPRIEAAEHHYNPVHTKLLDLGLQPTLLSDELVETLLLQLLKYRDRVVPSVIDPSTKWG
ncbi:MAG: hypothetical protein AB7L84_17195 [Acidimicrobiia bacterium]